MNIFAKQNNISRKILEKNKNIGEHFIIYEGNKFIIRENVFSPKFFNAWKNFTDYLMKENFNNKSILEIGAGTGITGLSLFFKNNLKKLILSDINKFAVKNCEINKIGLNLGENIQIIKSDIFENINEKFDIIYWIFPWLPENKNYKYNSELERGLFDPGYVLLERYIKESKKYLNTNGRIFIGFGDFGDLNILENISLKYGFKLKELVRKKGMEGVEVEFILYELI